jgi:sugar lactone lactonase YvrE
MERTLSILSPTHALPSVTTRPHGLLEAPRHGGDGSVLYSDVLGGGVYRVPVSGDREPETVVPKRRGIGGMVNHRDGGVVVTGRGVVHVDGERQRELLSLDGVAGFNDMTTDSAGRVLAGALRFQPFAGEDPVPTEVWRITAPGVAEVVAKGIDWPNGIALSADDDALYVSDTANGVVRVFASGSTDGDVFASPTTGTVDGLALDEEGGVCFGGPDRRDVFITTADNPLDPEKGGTVFHARAEVAGVEVGAATI